MQTTASSSSLAGRLTGSAVRDALPSSMTPGSSPSSWLPYLSRSSNDANAPIGAGSAFYDEVVSRISSIYKSLATSVHGSFASDQRRGSSIEIGALVREIKNKDISRLISSTLSSSISSSRARLASNWSAWQVPLVLTGPLHAISSCSYAQPVFESFHINEPREQEKFLLASIILGVFIALTLALGRVMSYYNDQLESHLSRNRRIRHQDQDDGRFIMTDRPSSWFYRRLPRLYGRNVHNSRTVPQYDESLNSTDYTNCSDSATREVDSQTSAGDHVKLHHDGRVWRINFAAGALQNKVVTVEDIRHVAAQLLNIPYLTCFPIVNHFPVPATDGSEDLLDAYTFGWRNGAEGWCHQVGDPLEGGSLSTRNDNREWPGTVEIYANGIAKNETVAKVWLNHTNTQSSTGKKRRNKKGNKKKTSAQSLRGLRSEFASLSTGNDMGNGASKEMANGRSQHVPPQTSAPSGRPQLTTRSLEPPKYNINSTPHSEILALLTRYFTKELKPCMDDYIAGPPTAAKQRDAEYLILNERCERDIILQLDALVCDGDTDMRTKRKSLTNAVHQELKLLDEAVIAAGGKKRGC